MRNIVLIGMPGCGKSTVGVVLAKSLGMDFVDSDLVIQSTMGATLAQLIEHRPEEIKLIDNMRRRNPNTGLVVFWVKLRQRGYTRSISGLYRFLRKRGQMAVKLPNPKYIPKPYEQMTYPGQRGQIDVKFVPAACLVSDAADQKFYQYTFIDEYSRFRYLEAFEEHSTYSSSLFLRHVVEKFPYAIECIQTDNGSVHQQAEQFQI